MRFDGAPEIVNCRLAMLGFVAGLGAELSTNESVYAQFTQAAPTVIAVAALFTAATLAPILKGNQPESFGPFEPRAELLNGRIACLGLAGLLIVEAVKGSALF